MIFTARKLTALALLLSLAAAALPSTVFADGIAAVTPNSVTNNVDNTITISLTGSGYSFQSGAIALLNGFAVSTTVWTNGVLTAVVPAGFSPGTYSVTVRNPDNSEIPCDAGGSCLLTVNAYVPPSPTATLPFARPQMIVKSSGANVNRITTGAEFKFAVDFENAGNMTAFNAQAVFSSADLIPLRTGGVAALGNINPGSNIAVDQRFVSAGSLSGKTFVLIDVVLTYYDDKGASYSDKFTLTVPVAGGGGGSGAAVTSTPTGIQSGQLIIPSYSTSIEPLQPGSRFTLTMTVQNTGNDKAQRVTMILGGGSSGGGGGTPQPGGVSGGSGEFTNFAPVGTSNIQSLGDIPAGGSAQISQDLIVNVSTNPGAYPMKVTFSYLNKNGEVINDEQVITLLVYSLPNIEISFYRPLDPFFAGQPAPLPLQLVNLGKRTAVLGTMTVTAQGGVIEGGTSLVGPLDAGGYFTFDPMLLADSAGAIQVKIVIDYTDDFNQPRTIEKTLEVTVEEGFLEPTPEPGGGNGGGDYPPAQETFLQKLWRFILGLLGLDSAPPPPSTPDLQPPPQFEPEIPLPGGGSGPKG